MVFSLWFYNIIKTIGKRKKEDHFLRKKGKKTEKTQNSVTIMAYEDGKGTVFSVKLKLEGESFE